jgi:glucan phosphoethanolaminetransferase (alkaline phosphatase superfamily)
MADGQRILSPLETSARVRRWVGRGLFAVPGIAVVAFDASVRHEQMAAWSTRATVAYIASALLGAMLWGALVGAASRRASWVRAVAHVVLVAGAALAVGAQIYFFHRYHAYINPRAVLVGTSMLPSIGQQLWIDRMSFARALLPPIAIAVLLPIACARLGPIRRVRWLVALDAAVAALLLALFCAQPQAAGEQGATPDVLYLSAMGRLAYARWDHEDGVESMRPGARTPLPLAPIADEHVAIPPALGGRPSLLFIVTESVRATDVCVRHDPACATTPYTNALLPDRFALAQMRALDSTTAVSLAVLWSGMPPTASRQDLHSMPLLWEYAHAAGYGTAYFTSQNMFFANSGLWLEGLPLSRMVSATDLEPDPTYETGADDVKLVDRTLAEVDGLRAPWVAVVHLSNTHFPYTIDPEDAPFQPESAAFGAGDAEAVRNRYKDAIHRQDKEVARLVRGVRARPGGERVVVAFISDHGEQIRERGAIGHTYTVHDEEVRVPFWIDAPKGAITPRAEEQLRALADVPLTMLDVMPTLLDVAGIWDAPEIATMRARMPGTSLLRGGTPPDRGVVLTNCSAIFACAARNWGAMRGTKKLIAMHSDTSWRCFDVATDPSETHDLGPEACGDLGALAEAEGRGTPF